MHDIVISAVESNRAAAPVLEYVDSCSFCRNELYIDRRRSWPVLLEKVGRSVVRGTCSLGFHWDRQNIRVLGVLIDGAFSDSFGSVLWFLASFGVGQEQPKLVHSSWWCRSERAL